MEYESATEVYFKYGKTTNIMGVMQRYGKSTAVYIKYGSSEQVWEYESKVDQLWEDGQEAPTVLDQQGPGQPNHCLCHHHHHH